MVDFLRTNLVIVGVEWLAIAAFKRWYAFVIAMSSFRDGSDITELHRRCVLI